MRFRRTVAAVLLAVACSACGKDDPPADAAITMIDAGAQPRRILRYRPQVGRATYEMTSVQTNKQPVSTMTTRAVVDAEVIEASPDGGARMRVVVRDLTLEGGPPGADAAFPRGMKIIVNARTSARGRMSDVSFEFEPKDDPKLQPVLTMMSKALEQTISSVVATLPEEPVGVGARWTLAQPVTVMSTTQVVTSESTLVSWDGDSATLRVAMTTTAKDQAMDIPGSARKARLVSLDGQGQGTVTLDLRGMMGLMDSTMTMRSTISMEGQKEPFTHDQEVSVSFRPAR